MLYANHDNIGRASQSFGSYSIELFKRRLAATSLSIQLSNPLSFLSVSLTEQQENVFRRHLVCKLKLGIDSIDLKSATSVLRSLFVRV